MRSLSSALALDTPLLRLRPRRGQLLCLVRAPRFGGRGDVRRELALVASPTAPYLRHLVVYRPRQEPDVPEPPTGGPRPAA